MAALTIAQNTLSQESRPFPNPQPKTHELLSYILHKYEVIDPATSTVPTVESILADQDLQKLIDEMGKSSSKEAPKKASGAKASKVSDTDRNSEEYDSCRCCARIWKAEGGLGFDNIQCNSKNMVSAEVAKDILLKLDCAPKEEDVENFLEGYEGSFCKKHLSQDFMMPKGYWLGKVNEKRPEEPMLPTGSIKKGYSEEYKPHQWMYDGNGDKVEKKGRRSSPKKVVDEPLDAKPPTQQSDEEVEEKAPEKVEEEEKAPDEKGKEDVKQMEEFRAWKAEKKENEQTKVEEEEVVVEEKKTLVEKMKDFVDHEVEDEEVETEVVDKEDEEVETEVVDKEDEDEEVETEVVDKEDEEVETPVVDKEDEEVETEVIEQNTSDGEETEELSSEEGEEVEIITHYKKEYYIVVGEKPQYIYAIEDGELGDKVGEIDNGKKVLYKSSKN